MTSPWPSMVTANSMDVIHFGAPKPIPIKYLYSGDTDDAQTGWSTCCDCVNPYVLPSLITISSIQWAETIAETPKAFQFRWAFKTKHFFRHLHYAPSTWSWTWHKREGSLQLNVGWFMVDYVNGQNKFSINLGWSCVHAKLSSNVRRFLISEYRLRSE